MEKLRTIIITMLLIGGGIVAFAQGEAEVEHYTLNMHLKSGNIVGITFNRRPTITMSNGNIVFSSTTTEAEYAISDIERFTIDKGGVYTLISLTPIDKEDISMRHNGQNQLLICGKPSQMVQLVTSDGTTIYTQHTDDNGQLQLSLDRYPSGIYIVKSGKTQFKIIRK